MGVNQFYGYLGNTMGQLSSVLRSLEGNGLAFWCPGCDTSHHIKYGHGRWKWDGDVGRGQTYVLPFDPR